MFLEQEFLGNPIEKWILALAVAILSIIIARIILSVAARKLRKLSTKTKTNVDNLVAELLTQTKFFFLFIIGLFIGSKFMDFSEKVDGISNSIVILALLLQAAFWGTRLIAFMMERYREKRFQDDAASVTTFAALAFVARLVLFSVLLLLALDNVGIDITALIAGLGIGGIAIALAVQNVLGDLFASLSIVLDKPFVLGDFIIVDNYLGSIEHIGLKTTRIRSLSGEQLIFSNADLLSSRIRNYKRMAERRVVFSIGVIYQTTLEQLREIPQLIRETIEAQEMVRYDRAHFKEYGDFSLNFEIVYWIASPDYNIYMDIQQAINLEIFEKFKNRGIEFAYPSQTLFIAGNNGDIPADLSRSPQR